MAPVTLAANRHSAPDAERLDATGFVGVLNRPRNETQLEALGDRIGPAGASLGLGTVVPSVMIADVDPSAFGEPFMLRLDLPSALASDDFLAAPFRFATSAPQSARAPVTRPPLEHFTIPPRAQQAAVAAAVPAQRPSKAFGAFKDLARWLHANDDEIASMIGIGRTTVYTWQRDGREPRPATARKLFQAHAVMGALVQQLGEDGAYDWLAHEASERRTALMAGDIAGIQSQARPIIFGDAGRTRPGTWLPEPTDTDDGGLG